MAKYTQPKNIREKKAKKEASLKFWKVFLIEGGLFLLTSVLAIVSAFELNKLIKIKKIYLPTTSLQDFLLSFLLVMLFVLFFVYYKKASKINEFIFKGLFIITVFWGGMTVLNIFLPVFGSVLIIGVLIILWLEMPTVWIQDILMVLGLAGASSFFGLRFTPSVMVAILLIFSFYDFIAVYKTKHMVALAKEMIDKKVILGFIIPKEARYFKDKIKIVKPGGNFMILGGGDIVFPCLLAVAVIPSGFIKALIVVIFSLFGVLLGYWLFTAQKDKDPMPALPPIALLAIVGYFITILF